MGTDQKVDDAKTADAALERTEPFASVAFQDLTVFGFGTPTDYQKTFSTYPLALLSRFGSMFGRSRDVRRDILRNCEGVVSGGQTLLVLGRPGSGCTTLLKVLSGRTHGLRVEDGSQINYQGLSMAVVRNHFRGACTYLPESDLHFPHLTVSQTLQFAAQARPLDVLNSPLKRINAAKESMKWTLDALGLEKTLDTKVGNSFVRGISGGERKRVSIAEALVGKGSLQCWDNSTRGLDSANALQFVQSIRSSAKDTGSTAIASLYQVSENIYNTFDKVMLLYEGRQIFFGSTTSAKSYFLRLGFDCHPRAVTADFLCSITNPVERIVKDGYDLRVPRSPDEFARIWSTSPERVALDLEIQSYQKKYPAILKSEGGWIMHFEMDNRPPHAPYKVGFAEQVYLCVVRAFHRLLKDLPPVVSAILGNAIISIILGSMFYNMPDDTSSFFGRGILLFFTILTNTFLASFEGVQLWDHRPIVEKHFQFAFYRPSAEAIASMLCDLPNKVLLTACFNIPFYFLANMRRTPQAFFTFYLFAFVSLLTGSMLYRTIGAMSRTLTSSIAPGADFILLLVIYTGFVLPIPSMHPWLRWFGYVNPVGYAFESLMINEFADRRFPCVNFAPKGSNYSQATPSQKMCTITGARPGQAEVNGDAYLAVTFQYFPWHLWRNLGILFGLMSFLCCIYLLATEYIPPQRSKGEVLIFQKGGKMQTKPKDEETQELSVTVSKEPKAQTSKENTDALGEKTKAATFVWNELSYDIKANGETRRLLDNIEGWVKPGTLTALMGASGAGKTTLLNVLANRVTTGVIRGETVVDSKYENEGFARKVGYAQQQDINTPTATVREALVFSALLRQPPEYTEDEKLAYVDEVISTLNLSAFANAIIGAPGEGLNIEQRKRVTIGIELAARPELLLFLDEPTSGLDSNTAWSICKLLRRLADSGQAILCTIHQPSGVIFEMFDRLLLIQNGHSIYFGDIGPNSQTMVKYFRQGGLAECHADANPAEWLMDIISEGEGKSQMIDWQTTWENSPERRVVKAELELMKRKLQDPQQSSEKAVQRGKYASPYLTQLYHVTRRNLEQDWRTPSYLYSKLFLTLGAGLVNGFSFYMSANSIQGIQNQIFSVFLIFTLHSSLVQLIMPQFLQNRTLYEHTERPSRTYSWTVFVTSNIISEIPWQTLLAVIQFVTWYYPVGMYQNALITDRLDERGGLMFLLIWSYMLFSSTFSQMVVTIMPDAATGINISALFYSLSLIFCGVLVSPSAMPHFWIFMYRATPLTYFTSAMVSTGLSGVEVQCAQNEILTFDAPSGQSCGAYLEDYINTFGGRLLNSAASQRCQLCPVTDTDSVIAAIGFHYDHRWRDFGITLVYSIINIAGALILYWSFRVPKSVHREKRR